MSYAQSPNWDLTVLGIVKSQILVNFLLLYLKIFWKYILYLKHYRDIYIKYAKAHQKYKKNIVILKAITMLKWTDKESL